MIDKGLKHSVEGARQALERGGAVGRQPGAGVRALQSARNEDHPPGQGAPGWEACVPAAGCVSVEVGHTGAFEADDLPGRV